MPSVFVCFPTPTNVELFDRRYRDEHIPLATAHLGMAKYRPHPVLGAIVGKPAYHLVVEIQFDSAVALEKALKTSGVQTTITHAHEISTGGPPVMLITK